jgi:ribosomal protein S27AE
MSAPRRFDANTCEITDHQVGDRHRYPGDSLDDEWDGQTWAPVCPSCDVAMRDRDTDGRLRCGQCLTLYTDARGQS